MWSRICQSKTHNKLIRKLGRAHLDRSRQEQGMASMRTRNCKPVKGMRCIYQVSLDLQIKLEPEADTYELGTTNLSRHVHTKNR